MVFWCTLYWHSFFFSQWKFMLMMRPSWLHGLVQVSSMLFFFFLQYFCFISWLSLAHSTNAHFHCLSVQCYILLKEVEKNCKLNDLDALDFNQVIIFVKSVTRAAELSKLLTECDQSCWVEQVTLFMIFTFIFHIFIVWGKHLYGWVFCSVKLRLIDKIVSYFPHKGDINMHFTFHLFHYLFLIDLNLVHTSTWMSRKHLVLLKKTRRGGIDF